MTDQGNLAISFICTFARFSFFGRDFKSIHPIRSFELVAHQIRINWINLKTQWRVLTLNNGALHHFAFRILFDLRSSVHFVWILREMSFRTFFSSIDNILHLSTRILCENSTAVETIRRKFSLYCCSNFTSINTRSWSLVWPDSRILIRDKLVTVRPGHFSWRLIDGLNSDSIWHIQFI